MVNHMKYALKKVPHYIWWILTILFLISSIVIFYFFIEIPVIHLNGKEQMILTYQKAFHDPGYQVKTKIFHKKVSDCTVKGTVNTKKLEHTQLHILVNITIEQLPKKEPLKL